MDSWNQTNPIENWNELLRNINNTKIKLDETSEKTKEVFLNLLNNPQIKNQTIKMLEVLEFYYKQQIDINQFLSEKVKSIDRVSQYYLLFVKMNQYLKNLVVELKNSIEKGEIDKINSWMNRFYSFDYLFKKYMGNFAISLIDQIKTFIKNIQAEEQFGGGINDPYNYIFDFDRKKWVDVKSNRGLFLLKNYLRISNFYNTQKK